jgi:preprotein translocase subunit SecG
MFVFMCILLVLAGILLVAAVLIQPGKGAGLTAGMGGVTGQISGMFGARRTADFLQKFTIGLALAILLLAVVTNKFFLSTPSSAVGAADERAPITTGAAKPAPQPIPQGAPAQGAPQQAAPQGQQQAQPQQAQPQKK